MRARAVVEPGDVDGVVDMPVAVDLVRSGDSLTDEGLRKIPVHTRNYASRPQNAACQILRPPVTSPLRLTRSRGSGAGMPLELNAHEQRVIGCLLEKQVSTPDQYPLSLNALVNACNQRSNRDPVLDLDERTVQGVVDGLTRKQLLLEKSGFGSRVPKYQHLFCNTQFGSLKFSPQETAIICELLVRGPQTPGELRSRAARLAPFNDVSEVETAL